MKRQELVEKVNKLINPYTNELVFFDQSIVEMNIEDDKIMLNYRPLGTDDNLNKSFNRELIKLLKFQLGFKSVKIVHPEIKSSEELQIGDKTTCIAIMSGKGGVGKSQVTVNLAQALVRQGKKVGIIDADIYGYSIPKILNLYGTPHSIDQKIIPLKTKEGIEVISAQYFIEDNKNEAIVWRASLLNQMMAHFFYDVKWDQELDYILIDLPPGTGDITLNINTYLDEVSAIVVTTANKDAAHVAVRSGMLAKELGFDVLGVIENMSYYQHNAEKLYIFGKGGASEVSAQLDIPMLSQIPISDDKEKLNSYFEDLVNNLVRANL